MRPLPGWACRGALCAAILALPAARVAAQSRTDSLSLEVARLASVVDSLSREVARLRQTGQEDQAQDALAQLRAAAAQAAGGGAAATAAPPEAPEDQEFVGRQRSLQAFNPEISLNTDMFMQIDKDAPHEKNFFPREFELSVVSNLDPYSRARVFFSKTAPGGELLPFGGEVETEDAISVEEGYVEWVGLPGGLSVKLGKFAQQFGQLNRWHSHALPFQTRSLPHVAFIGQEWLAQTGVSVHLLAPFNVAGGTYEATVEVTRSENQELFGESSRPAVLGHLNGFWDLSSSLDLDLGVSWVNGSYEDSTSFFDRNLFGTEMALTWRPPGRSRYRGVTLRGGLMVLDGLVPQTPASGGPPVPLPQKTAMGYWGSTEVRLSQTWLVGARADRTENPTNPDETAWLLAPTLTWWQSEFVRLRGEYDLLGRSATDARKGQFLLQVTFAMGPHKHETY